MPQGQPTARSIVDPTALRRHGPTLLSRHEVVEERGAFVVGTVRPRLHA